MVSKKKIFYFIFFHYNFVEANDPWGIANLEIKGMVGRTLLHTKYISCGPHGFREEDFFKFFPLYVYGS